MMTEEPFKDSKITKIPSTKLDQLIQVLEISFIFLICFTFITLVNEALLKNTLDLYSPISGLFLGRENVGSLDGGNFGEIVRITLVFNLLLFTVSLMFGLWMRKTRDNWTLSKMGFTFRTEKYSFLIIVRRAILLGLLVIVLYYLVLTPVVFVISGGNVTEALLFHSFHNDGVFYTAKELNAEYYFGFVEMGFIWPLSAGFFFFSYVYNSFKVRFPVGVANLVSTIFYVVYLVFFFMIPQNNKLEILFSQAIFAPIFWANFLTFSIVLYISFSAFAETESIVLPFLLNFVFNVGLTAFRAINSLVFTGQPESSYIFMLIPFALTSLIVLLWFFYRREDFSTITSGWNSLKEVFSRTSREVSLKYIIGMITLFFTIAFLLPGILEHIVAKQYSSIVFAGINALIYVFLIVLALVILNYSPSKVYDVLLVKIPDGLPISSEQKLFQSDEVLISGFFQAISSVSDELDEQETKLRSIKRGEREILIEDGVMTRIIALADRDHSRIREAIVTMQREFEAMYSHKILDWIGDRNADITKHGHNLVKKIGSLEIKFDIPAQAKWIAVLTLIFTPIMIGLIGLI